MAKNNKKFIADSDFLRRAEIAVYKYNCGECGKIIRHGYELLFGGSADEFGDDPESLSRRIHTEDRKAFELARSTLLTAAKQTGSASSNIIYRVRHAEGRWVWVRDKCDAILGDAGEVTRVGTLKDITEQRHTAEALRASEERLRLLTKVDNEKISEIKLQNKNKNLRNRDRSIELADSFAGIGIFELDFINQKRIWSPEMFRMLGLPTSTATPSWTQEGLYDVERPEGNIYPWRKRIAETEDRRQIFKIEVQGIHQLSGEPRDFLVVGRCTYNELGDPSTMVGIKIDISELKEAQRHLRKQHELNNVGIEAASAGIWEMDFIKNKFKWSAETFELYGYDHNQEPPPLECWLDLVHPEDRERVARSFATLLNGDSATSAWREEYRVNKREGQTLWLLSAGKLQRTNDGEPQFLQGIVIDVTERRQSIERQTLLAHEVDHRSKNTLAVVLSLIHFTKSDTLNNYRISLEKKNFIYVAHAYSFRRAVLEECVIG